MDEFPSHSTGAPSQPMPAPPNLPEPSDEMLSNLPEPSGEVPSFLPEPSAPPAPSKPLTMRERFAKLAKRAFNTQAFCKQRSDDTNSNFSRAPFKRDDSSSAHMHAANSKDVVFPSSGDTTTGDRIDANRIGAHPALEISVRQWGSNAVPSGGGASGPGLGLSDGSNTNNRTATFRSRMHSMVKGAMPKNLNPGSMVRPPLPSTRLSVIILLLFGVCMIDSKRQGTVRAQSRQRVKYRVPQEEMQLAIFFLMKAACSYSLVGATIPGCALVFLYKPDRPGNSRSRMWMPKLTLWSQQYRCSTHPIT